MSIFWTILFGLLIGVIDISLKTSVSSFLMPHVGVVLLLFFIQVREDQNKYLAIVPFGLLLDIYSSSFLGTHLFVLALVSFLLDMLTRRAVDKRGFVGILIVASTGSLLFEILVFMLLQFEKIFGTIAPVLSSQFVVQSLFRVMIQAIMVYLLTRLYQQAYVLIERNYLKKSHYS